MFTKLLGEVRAHFQALEARQVLGGLSDAALDDIGVTRAGIPILHRSRPVRALHASPIPCANLNLSFAETAQAA